MDEEQLARLRALTNEVDSYFSLLYYRHSRKPLPMDLEHEIVQVLSRLRAFNDSGVV